MWQYLVDKEAATHFLQIDIVHAVFNNNNKKNWCFSFNSKNCYDNAEDSAMASTASHDQSKIDSNHVMYITIIAGSHK